MNVPSFQRAWPGRGEATRRARGWLLSLAFALVASASAQTALDEDSPWPRVRATNGHTVTLHLPQVENWTSNSFNARAAVSLKPAGSKTEMLGVVWLAAHGLVDTSKRVVTLDRFEVTKARFPDAPDGGSNALAIVRDVVPAGARTVSLDYLVTALGFHQAAARQGPRGLKHEPPEILWVTNRTVLVLVHGEPVLKPVPDSALQRVVNTPALILLDPAGGRFFLNGRGAWYSAASLQGPWALVQTPPAPVAALGPRGDVPPAGDGPQPRVIVRTKPAELLVTGGLPDFRPIRGTSLQYAADTDSQLFFHATEREAYLWLSGRWFKAKSLAGPWTHVAPAELPADFAKIPPGSPQAIVLASVPGTRQAELAVLANSVPVTATVNRHQASLEVTYDGEPKFQPIDGTSLSYARNARLPVIRTADRFYALEDGVWFTAAAATGPWTVAAEVPEEIYSIPPSSPVYYATFATVLSAGDDEVEVGYTPGYTGTYEDDGTVVYGTGWDYEPWSGDNYYGWGWTWGYSYWYVPWYQWWVWRNWWDEPGALRSASIENVYNRWQNRPGVTYHDAAQVPNSGIYKSDTTSAYKPPASSAFNPSTADAYKPSSASAYKGYPAQYGRYQGATTPSALSPPQNTVALNPYTRPTQPVRPGEMPRGAQLLTAVRQSPGGGRDLYASPDGGVYLRKSDGWYRRDAGGDWRFAAPIQGRMERGAVVGARGAGQGGAGTVPRPVAGAAAAGRVGRVPDQGMEARSADIAALERQYYARSLAQYRAQNWRAGGVRRR